MNTGERDELIAQMKLLKMRQTGSILEGFGVIKNVGLQKEYSNLDPRFDILALSDMQDNDLLNLASSAGVSKAPARSKADVLINEVPVSLKSTHSAPPAIVNHTARPGFENVCTQVGSDISHLDAIIDSYWNLRTAGVIKEDVKNSDPNSPFASQKEFLSPILQYFLFKGTGSGLSNFPASHIISFSDPLDLSTWNIQDEEGAVNHYWENMVFSLRASKGMPIGYPDNLSARMKPFKSSIARWTRYSSNKYRGALHVRV